MEMFWVDITGKLNKIYKNIQGIYKITSEII